MIELTFELDLYNWGLITVTKQNCRFFVNASDVEIHENYFMVNYNTLPEIGNNTIPTNGGAQRVAYFVTECGILCN